MRAEPSREQAIAIADMDDVALIATGVADAARKAIAPDLEVVIGISAHRGNAGRAAGHVNFLDLVERRGEKVVGIGIAHVLLERERRPPDVVECLHGTRIEASVIEGLPVERNPLVALSQRPLEPVQLERLELAMVHVRDLVLVRHISHLENL